MPELTLAVAPNGVVISILVRPSEEQAQKLRAAGLAVPEAIQTTGFVDTGASHTMLDLGLVQKMKAANGFSLGAVGTSQQRSCKGYSVEIAVVDPDHDLRWIATIAGGLPVAGSGTQAALGRDFLANFRLNYNGPASQVTLSWD